MSKAHDSEDIPAILLLVTSVPLATVSLSSIVGLLILLLWYVLLLHMWCNIFLWRRLLEDLLFVEEVLVVG
jgi:predicted ABC-type exoprotein transport system permease subunit